MFSVLVVKVLRFGFLVEGWVVLVQALQASVGFWDEIRSNFDGLRGLRVGIGSGFLVTSEEGRLLLSCSSSQTWFGD